MENSLDESSNHGESVLYRQKKELPPNMNCCPNAYVMCTWGRGYIFVCTQEKNFYSLKLQRSCCRWKKKKAINLGRVGSEKYVRTGGGGLQMRTFAYMWGGGGGVEFSGISAYVLNGSSPVVYKIK